MDFNSILSASDAERASTTFTKLMGHWPQPPVLAGGLAIELHLLLAGLTPEPRHLNDIDLLAASFADIPSSLSRDLIFRHVHPHDPPGKTLLQSVDPESAVRVDVFCTYETIVARAIPLEFGEQNLRLISLEDLTARNARLCMDLAQGTSMPAKHVRDFLRLLPLAHSALMNHIWQEHRKPHHPVSFQQTTDLLARIIPATTELQTVPVYSKDVLQICPRCEPASSFPLADPSRFLSLLGYC